MGAISYLYSMFPLESYVTSIKPLTMVTSAQDVAARAGRLAYDKVLGRDPGGGYPN